MPRRHGSAPNFNTPIADGFERTVPSNPCGIPTIAGLRTPFPCILLKKWSRSIGIDLDREKRIEIVSPLCASFHQGSRNGETPATVRSIMCIRAASACNGCLSGGRCTLPRTLFWIWCQRSRTVACNPANRNNGCPCRHWKKCGCCEGRKSCRKRDR